MTDLSPDFDFASAMNEQIAAAAGESAPEPEPEVAEAQPEEPAEAQERPRGPDGRFLPKEEPDPEPEPEVAPVAESSDGDLRAQIALLEKRLADKDAYIDQRGNEIGELRKALEDRYAALEERLDRPQRQQITPSLIEDNPAMATQIAYEQGDEHSLRAAFEMWKDEDPASAASWRADKMIEAREAALEKQWQERYQQLEQRIAPFAQASVDQQRVEQIRQVAAEIPDIAQFVQSEEIGVLAKEFPLVGEALLQTDDPAKQAGALKTLYHLHRGRLTDTLKETAQEVAREQSEAARQATDEAFVASASTSTATAPVEKTEGEQIADRMAARIAARQASWDDAWERH